jgi:hypothetical protein
MTQGSDRLGFALEPGASVGIASYFRMQNFQRDIAIQPRITGAVDFAHAASAQRSLDFIRPEFRTRVERHSWASL